VILPWESISRTLRRSSFMGFSLSRFR
jgi:hypothetical protein